MVGDWPAPELHDDDIDDLADDFSIEDRSGLRLALLLAQRRYYLDGEQRDRGGTSKEIRESTDRIARAAGALVEALESAPPIAAERLMHFHRDILSTGKFEPPEDLQAAFDAPYDLDSICANGGRPYTAGRYSREVGWDGVEFDLSSWLQDLKALRQQAYLSVHSYERLAAEVAKRCAEEGSKNPLTQRDHAYRGAVRTLISFWEETLKRPFTIDNTDREGPVNESVLFAQAAVELITNRAALPKKVSSMCEQLVTERNQERAKRVGRC